MVGLLVDVALAHAVVDEVEVSCAVADEKILGFDISVEDVSLVDLLEDSDCLVAQEGDCLSKFSIL